MYNYVYDKTTGEFLYSKEAKKDPRRPERFVPLDNSTFTEPLKVSMNQVAVYEGEKWVIKKDFRNQFQCNLDTKEITIVESIGELKNNNILVLDEIAKKIKEDPQSYTIENNQVIENPHYGNILKIRKIESELARIQKQYEVDIEIPLTYPKNGFVYKPSYAQNDYVKLIIMAQNMPKDFQMEIEDATHLKERFVYMNLQELIELATFLALKHSQIRTPFSDRRSELEAEKKRLQDEMQ